MQIILINNFIFALNTKLMDVSNIFYTIGDFFGGTSKRGKKAFYNTRVPFMMNSGEVRINTIVPYKIYNSIPQVSLTVDKISAMFSNGVFKYQRISDNMIVDMPKELAALLEKPNIFQGQNAFLRQYALQYWIYGNQYIKKNKVSSLQKFPGSIINISPAYLKPVLTGKMFDQVEMSGVVERFDYFENGNVKRFETNDILWSKIGDLDNPIIGCSPLQSLEFPISNNELAYKYLNCISGEKGGIGILSQLPIKDSFGTLPSSPEEKKKLEAQYREQNGVDDDQKKILITDSPIGWTPMSYPTAQLLLLEQIDANFLTILNRYHVNSNIFVNSTYENLRHGLVTTHNDCIQPFADLTGQHFTTFLEVEKGYRIILDYSHLPYLQSDKVEEASTFLTVSNALNTLVTAQIITSQEAAKRLKAQFPE